MALGASHFSALTSVSFHSGQREMRLFFDSTGLSDAPTNDDALKTMQDFLYNQLMLYRVQNALLLATPEAVK